MKKAQYVMVGGFLGAGKTTAILKMAELLRTSGQRVGLITNDQSYGLVDTTMLESHGFPVQEITGGCFCCRFGSLVDASERLAAESAPDIFIAEPVGSCTDLKATVDYPLRRMYGDNYAIAPLSVLVDPTRALRILGLETGKNFSKKVTYIYAKQLEEAEIIVVNKADLLTPERLAALMTELARQFPRAKVLSMSARTGEGLSEWVAHLSGASARLAGAMDVDYETYAEAEALLGWLNCALNISGTEIDGNRLLTEFGAAIQSRLQAKSWEVAHLKMTLTPDENGHDLAVANLVRNDALPELSHRLQEPLDAGELIVNLRAECDPDELKAIVLECVENLKSVSKISAEMKHIESFKPGKPSPTHRMAGVS